MPIARAAFRLSVMADDHTSHGMARGTSPLQRHIDGIEFAVAGTWNVPGYDATVSFSVPRRLRRPDGSVARAREATLVLADDPGDVLRETGVLSRRATLGTHGVRPPAGSLPATATPRSLSIRAVSQTIGEA
jgi:hypothetical protein